MKRSRSVKLVLMSAVPVMLTACGDDAREPVIYQSVDSCVQAGEMSAAECNQRFNEAWSEHQQTAPRFTSREECARQYSAEQCQETRAANGGSFFMPALMGFMVGRALNNFGAPRLDQRNLQRDDTAVRGAPLYKGRGDRDTWRTATNQPVNAKVAGDPNVARRGFGDSSARRSSYGG
jgi:uncharacterized protein YgiB involved in biofilm formation